MNRSTSTAGHVNAPPGRLMTVSSRMTTTAGRLAVPAIIATFLFAGCAAGTGDLGAVATAVPTPGASLDVPTAQATPGGPAPSSTAPASTPDASSAATTTVRAYFFLGSFTGNAGLVPVTRAVAHTQAVGAAAISALLSGPNAQEQAARPALYTDVPSGTRFLGLSIANGVATVNLSAEFASGGAVSTVAGRFAQVVYTLTQFPTVTTVRFTLDGVATPASVAGGASHDVVTRSDYADQLPAIFVDRPAWGGSLGTPARITGVANVFEAQFRIAIVDGSGAVLVDRAVTASCGTGCWGTFDLTVDYTVATGQWGTTRVYDLSAKDGSPQDVIDYPVWLSPAP